MTEDLHGTPIILAGGLTAENVGEAVKIPGVMGVDVSSGVERKGQPGMKDGDLVRGFLEAAKLGGKGKM